MLFSNFSNFFSKNTQLTTGCSELNYDKLPIFTAQQLIEYTKQHNRIRSIRRIIKIDDERFQILYLDVIYEFAEIVQLMPASQNHHHAVPGGLFIHTLEVVENSMNIRQKYKLPAFAEPEVQEREKHAWSYAIFVAAILHDIGKRVTLCDFIVKNEIHSAFSENLPYTKNKHYKISFKDSKYHTLHDKLGLAFSDILPKIGRNFLFAHLNIISEMMAYIHGDKINAGMIGEIISKADQNSTKQSLAHSSSRKFKGANSENFGERLMTTLRLLIASNQFVINKPNANIYTNQDGYTYCVSKVVVDAIRDEFHKNGETDIPSDNIRIFDIFQEYGFLETNHKTGKSMHNLRIMHEGNIKVFTVLKFRTAKLFQNPPLPFIGALEEVENKGLADNLQHGHTKPKTMYDEGISQSYDPFPEAEASNPFPEAEASNPFPEAATNVFETVPQKPVADKTVTMHVADKKELTSADESFLQWLRDSIKEKKIIINESYGIVQKVNYQGDAVMALVTPKAFAEYANTIGLDNPNEKSTFSKIQSALHKNKINIPAPRGQIHKYKIKKSLNNSLNGNRGISHYLITIEKFCGNDNDLLDVIKKISINDNLVNV